MALIVFLLGEDRASALRPELARHRELLVGDPAAVEAERDPGWQVDTGEWFGGEVLGGEDDEVGRTSFGVVDECHEVAVVLGGVGR